MLKSLLSFIPAKWRVREEVKAKGEGQLALARESLDFWGRMGWSPEAARYLATAFAFGVKENVAAVLEKAQELSDTPDFEREFMRRVSTDASVAGAALEASKFTSSEELRDLLGRILAGDTLQPGSVSRRAVSVAQDLTPHDLHEFLRLRMVVWRIAGVENGTLLLVLGKRTGLFAEKFLSLDSNEIGIDYHTFGDFQQLGLVQERAYGLAIGSPEGDMEEFYLEYGGKTIRCKPNTTASLLQMGIHALTKAGDEILSLFMSEEFVTSEDYFEEACEYWRTHGFDIAEVHDSPSHG